MRGVPVDVVGQNGQAYDEHTHVPELRLLDSVTALDCCEITAVLRRELAEGEGTPEWRAWVERAARRHGVRQEMAA